MNSIARIHIVGLIFTINPFLNIPQTALRTTYETIPNMMPSETLYARGIIKVVRNAGIASEKSSQLISLNDAAMMTPTTTRTEPVAALGIARNNGEKSSARAKHTAITNEVRPERPPSITPDALSM